MKQTGRFISIIEDLLNIKYWKSGHISFCSLILICTQCQVKYFQGLFNIRLCIHFFSLKVTTLNVFFIKLKEKFIYFTDDLILVVQQYSRKLCFIMKMFTRFSKENSEVLSFENLKNKESLSVHHFWPEKQNNNFAWL